MEHFGFLSTQGSTTEYLPTPDGLNTPEERRRLFLAMHDALVGDPELRFGNAPAKANLLELFGGKIEALLTQGTPDSEVNQTHTAILEDFFRLTGAVPPPQWQQRSTTAKAARLARQITAGKVPGLRLRPEQAFTHLIYHRMLGRNPESTLSIRRGAIEVHDKNGFPKTLIIPKYQEFSPFDPTHYPDVIRQGFDAFYGSGFAQLYMIFPKNRHFTRHLILDDLGGGRVFKVIPYSFSFCVEKKQCCGRCKGKHHHREKKQ